MDSAPDRALLLTRASFGQQPSKPQRQPSPHAPCPQLTPSSINAIGARPDYTATPWPWCAACQRTTKVGRELQNRASHQRCGLPGGPGSACQSPPRRPAEPRRGPGQRCASGAAGGPARPRTAPARCGPPAWSPRCRTSAGPRTSACSRAQACAHGSRGPSLTDDAAMLRASTGTGLDAWVPVCRAVKRTGCWLACSISMLAPADEGGGACRRAPPGTALTIHVTAEISSCAHGADNRPPHFAQAVRSSDNEPTPTCQAE